MKELGALFVAAYLISSFFLLPLFGLYLGLNLRQLSLGSIIRFHKILVLLSVALPLGIILFSGSISMERDLLKWGGSNQMQMTGGKATVESYAMREVAAFGAEQSANQLPVVRDVVFFFVDLIGLFSLAGVLIFVLRYALQSIRLSRIRWKGLDLKIGTNCRVIESAGIRLPFSVGYFRKCIFIPAGMPASEKRVVIRHELNHFRCRHHFWSHLEAVLACIFWFNPMTHLLRRRGACLRELECDRQTIRKIDKYAYTKLLLKTAEMAAVSGGDCRFSLLTQGWARKRELKMRIENLMNTESTSRKTVFGVLIAVTVVVTVGVALLYGNLNDANTQREILTGINLEYRERAPESSRIEIKKVPPHLIEALLTSEDSRFYEHGGINGTSFIRAVEANINSYLSGGPLFVQGGSSMTQQLAKQFIHDRKRTLKRKFNELKIARVLEKNFAKDEILEMYLNMVYFGNGAFGLKAASVTYFGHDYTQMTLSESAMLIPFLKAPDKNNLLNDPVNAEKRQAQLLKRMATAQGVK
jgi:beta-lactamase regulating signal transducer with metallopeptidase domain